jgi:hypothetical protein
MVPFIQWSSIQKIRGLTLLLMVAGVSWLVLCIGSAAMQDSSDNVSNIFKFAWPPFALSTVVGVILITAGRRSNQWVPLISLGWWTLGVSLACLILVALAIGGLI